MDKTVLNIKTDKSLKEKAQKVAKDMGLPLGTIMNQYLRELVDERRIVFQSPLMPNKATQKVLLRASEDYRRGVNISPTFTNVKEAMSWLESDED